MNDNDEARARSSSGNHATNDTNNGVVFSKRVDRALIGVGIALLALGTIRLVANVARTDWDDAVRTAASLAAVGAVLTVFVKPRSHGYFLGVGVILLICGVLVWPTANRNTQSRHCCRSGERSRDFVTMGWA